MQLQHQKIALDVNDTRAFTVLNAHQGDSKTRFIDITLTENGSTITLASSYVATVKASINNKTKAVNTAVVNSTNNVITVELTKTMLDTPGLLNCEVILQDNQQFVTSATFTVKVAESVISDESEIVESQEFGKLLDALTEIKGIEDKADRVQTLVDNIDKLKSADDIINRLSTSETSIETNKASIKELSELVQEVKNSALEEFANVNAELVKKEVLANKVNAINSSSDTQYPSTKAVMDFVNEQQKNPNAEIEKLKVEKVNVVDFNAYKTNNDSKVNNKVNITDFDTYKATTGKAIDKCVTDIANNSALINQNAIKNTTDKSTSVVLNDSSDCNIVGLFLYGNSIQSQVPTPTVPVNIDNVANPQIKAYRKNLFDMSRCIIHTSSKAIINSTDKVNSVINFTTNENTVNSGVYIRHTDLNTSAGIDRGYGVDYTKLNGKSVTLSFDIQSDVDCKINVQFTKYSYTYVDISSTKQRFSVIEVVDTSKLNEALCFYLNNVEATVTISNIQIEVGSIATDYESCECNSLTIEKSLHGIGDVCDTLTVNNDGTGYITQRLFIERITSQKKSTSYSWNYSATTNRFFRNDYSYSFDVKDNKPLILCSHLDVGENEKNTAFDNSIGWINVSGCGIAIRMTEFDGDIESFKKWLDDNEVYMVAPLAKPITVDLSKDEVDKILSLNTYYPSTTIVADTDFEVTYIADPKNYIDNKIVEVATALVAHESEVN